jgi:hypothetical protein
MIFNPRARRALKSLGGRFYEPWQLARIANHHKKSLDIDVKRFTYFLKQDKRYWFSFCQSKQVNAFAVPLGPDRYFLSLTSGIVFALYLGTIRLAEGSNAFSHLLKRDSTSITVVSPRLRGLHRQWERYIHSLITEYASLIKEPPPSAPQAQLALTMAHFALEFTLTHEVGHILDGHLDYTAKRAENWVPKVPRPEIHSIPPDFRQHFEITADEWACRFALSQLAGLATKHNYAEGPLIVAFGSSYFYNRSEAIDLWIFSVALLFIILGTWSGNDSDFFQSTHPFPAYRMQKVFDLFKVEEFAGWTEGTRFTDAYKTLEFVAKELASVKLGVQPLLLSLKRYIDENQAERIEERILAGLARDEPVLTRVRLGQAETSRIPSEIMLEAQALATGFNACLAMLKTRNFKDLEEVRGSAEFAAMKASITFQTLIHDENIRYLMASQGLNALLAHSSGADPRAVALVYALKDAFK